MTDEELRSAYARATSTPRPASRTACPSPDELLALARREGPEASRLATLDHAMGCESCQKELELLRAIEAAERRETGHGRAARWRGPLAIALAASALLAIGLGPGREWFGSRQPDAMRGDSGSVALLDPEPAASIAADSIVFAWRSVAGATRYVVELLDRDGNAVLGTTTIDTTVVLSRAAAPAGDYRWWVVAEVPGGQQRSEVRLLTLQPD